MTVSTTVTRNEYTGTAGVYTYAFTFRCDDAAWVEVYLDDVLQVAGYSATVNEDQDASPGGEVKFTVAPEGKAVDIRRVTPLTQAVDLQAYAAFPAESVESAVDKLQLQVQDQARERADADAAETAARIAADDAIIASGATPANVGIAVVTPTGAGASDTVANWLARVAVDGSQIPVLATGSSTARTLADRYAETVNVKDYGATGDGVTDDSAAIAAAIADGSGKRVYFPSGTYSVPALQTFSGLVGTTIEGDGGNSVIESGADASLWNFDATCWDVTVRALHLKGNSAASSGKFGLAFHGSECKLENARVSDFNVNVKVNSESAYDCHVTGCTVFDAIGSTSGNGYGVYNIGNRTVIANNSILNSGRHHVYLSGSSTKASNDCVVVGNIMDTCGVEGIAIFAYSYQIAVAGCVVAGNVILNTTTKAIGVTQRVEDCVISGNTIRAAGTDGVRIEGSTVANSYPVRIAVTGNVITGSGDYHVLIINASQCLVAANVMGGTPSTAAIAVGNNGTPTSWPSENVIGPNIISGTKTVAIGSDGATHFANEVRDYRLRADIVSTGTTIDVTGRATVTLSHAAPTTVTNLTGGVEGQEVCLYFTNGNVTINRDNAKLAGGANFTGTADDTLTLVLKGSTWIEKARSVNS